MCNTLINLGLYNFWENVKKSPENFDHKSRLYCIISTSEIMQLSGGNVFVNL